jgi:hypothetical protein
MRVTQFAEHLKACLRPVPKFGTNYCDMRLKDAQIAYRVRRTAGDRYHVKGVTTTPKGAGHQLAAYVVGVCY